MSTIQNLISQIKYVDQTEALKRILSTTEFIGDFDTDVSKLLDLVSADRRVDALKHLHAALEVTPTVPPSTLLGIFNKLKEDDGLRALGILERRISPLSHWVELDKILDRISERDRFKAVEILKERIDRKNDETLLSMDDIARLTRRTPNFVLPFVLVLKNWVATSLDFTRVKYVLESSLDKNVRLEILGELVRMAPFSPPCLMCSDLRSIISTLPQRTAFKGLKIVKHLLHPQIDLRRVELVFECVMKTDQVKALGVLLGRSEGDTEVEGEEEEEGTLSSSRGISSPRLGSVCGYSSSYKSGCGIITAEGLPNLTLNDVKMIVEKMAEPYKGLELIKDRIDPSIEISKIASVINVIPPIRRLAALNLLLDLSSVTVDRSSAAGHFSAFDVRSVLMLMEPNVAVEALRMMVGRFKRSSERDTERVLECFSEANRAIARTVLMI